MGSGLYKRILLASHGTKGAIAAEDKTLQICSNSGTIDHLIVVPEFWQDITGDDWLNNGVTRDQFRDYLQTELGREVDQQCTRLNQKVTAYAFGYRSIILFGKPDKALIQCAETNAYDLVVLGSPRPQHLSGLTGLHSTMLTNKTWHKLQTDLLIVPYPQ